MSEYSVVHIALSPLAGSPIRICKASNAYTKGSARFINLEPQAYKTRTFEEDLDWRKDRAEAEALVHSADILHFHHYFNFGSKDNPFGFDFLSAMKPGAKYLMHWHSYPTTVSRMTGKPVEELVNAPFPQMVVAQFHESYYPNALPVPLIVDVDGPAPQHTQRPHPVFFFSPSLDRHAYVDRWETKGKPQVVAVLNEVKYKGLLDYRIIENLPFDECMRLRLDSDVVIDDLVTGGFHTTALEGLAAGKPTLCYVDHRTQLVLAELTGSTDLPLINVRYSEAAQVMEELAQDPELRADIGAFSRAWMVEFYSERKMIAHYDAAYRALLAGDDLKNPRYTAHRRAKLWLYTRVPDLLWQTRKARESDGQRLEVARFALIARWRDLKAQLRKSALLRGLWQRLKRMTSSASR